MGFFKRKQVEEVSPELILQKKISIEKNKLADGIEEEIDNMVQSYNRQSLLYKIDEKLQLEKYKYPDLDTYKYEVLKKTIFYKEIIKSLSTLLASILRQQEEISKDIEEQINELRQMVYLQMEQLIEKHYDDFFIRYLSIEEGINGLEREYKEQLLKYEWFKEMVIRYHKTPLTVNKEIPVRWAVRRIEELCYQKVSETIYL